jgi:preprotein translocase subunit SecD
MSVTKEWRISLLLLLVLLSGMLIWKPWQGLNPEIRGIQYGIDIGGGSRIYLLLEASHVTLQIDNEDAIGDIIDLLENNQFPVSDVPVSPYDNSTKQITIEIGRTVTRERIENIIDNKGEVISVEEAVSDETRDEVMHLLEMRVDPYGVLGTQFIAVEKNLVRFEVALELDRAIELLGHQGRLEIFIENNLVLYGDHITDVGSVRLDPSTQSWGVPFGLSDDGAGRWESASAGRVDYPTGIYLDRPSDETILLFDEGLLEELQEMTYDENSRMFYISQETLGRDVEQGIHLLVAAAKITENTIPPETFEFLHEQYENGMKTRILLLGGEDDFSENLIVTIENLGYPSPDKAPRLSDETGAEWVGRVCGLRSTPTISEDVAGKRLYSMIITTGGSSDAAKKRAEDLRVVLSQRLPVGISFESEYWIEPRLGAEFMNEAIRAALLAFAGVGVLIYLRYRHLKISAAIMGTMLSEIVIILGLASALGWTIGLAEIGGLIAVVGTGVDHQIIITDEVLRGALPHAQKVSLKGRIGRAFSIIFAAAATTIAAMLLLATVGFGTMRGFALITIAGIIIAVLLTRPAYARVLRFMMAKEKPEIMV